MRVLILGADGYIGWPLTMYLHEQGHQVFGIDNLMRRENVKAIGSDSAIPIRGVPFRRDAFKENFGEDLWFSIVDLRRPGDADMLLEVVRPDTIVHLAEQPSAPYSMKSENHCIATMENNVNGTLHLLYAMKKYCRDAHLIKLGSMGEYGTPGVTIPEGFFGGDCVDSKVLSCSLQGLPFPKQPGSFYHASKVHDSINIDLACKIWGLRSTDIMQGIVYGTFTSEDSRLATRFDYDQYFGTVINRFCAQAAVGHPLTVYGKGKQWRSFLPLPDSLRCIGLLVKNPPLIGEYRVVNQFDEITYIAELAKIVKGVCNSMGMDVTINEIPNPRVEEEDHRYQVERKILDKLGYVPRYEMADMVEQMILDLLPHKDRIDTSVIKPTTDWRT